MRGDTDYTQDTINDLRKQFQTQSRLKISDVQFWKLENHAQRHALSLLLNTIK